MIIWITGISGVGKTTFAHYLYDFFKKKKINFLHLDGDKFRKMFNNDLGYSLKDRNKNAERLIDFVSFFNSNKVNMIISANLTSLKYRLLVKKKFKNCFQIHLDADMKIIKKRDKRKIYQKKSVVGKKIKIIKNNTHNLKILNNDSKKSLKKKIRIISTYLKKNKTQFY